MRVKVSYTLDLEEVPKLIEDLLSDCRASMVAQLDNLETPVHNLEKVSNKLKDVREQIGLVDSKLEDCINMAQGYYSAVHDPSVEDIEAILADSMAGQTKQGQTDEQP